MKKSIVKRELKVCLDVKKMPQSENIIDSFIAVRSD